jgi:hypothetical protein
MNLPEEFEGQFQGEIKYFDQDYLMK